MQIGFHTKRLHFVILAGDDADPAQDAGEAYVQLAGGDLTVAPVEETYDEQEEDARVKRRSFGFA